MKQSNKVFSQLFAAISCSVILTILFRICHYYTENGLFLSLYITFLTISYHFMMRVAVGETVTVFCKYHTFRYDALWWRSHGFEKKLYQLLRVKRWKVHMITAKPEQFDIRHRSIEELLHNITQAELVHEIIMVLSFVPVLWIHWFGAAAVFWITSIFACLVDAVFVMMQRFNRPRVMKLRGKKSKYN